jgi:hypothetical protein
MLIQTESGRYFWSAMYQQNPVAMGGNFINTEHLLVDELPVPMPAHCKMVYAVIDTAMKDGAEHDSTAVIYAAYVDIPEPRVIILDYDAVSINGAFLIEWLPSVYKRLAELSEQCKPRLGSMAFVEDKGSGTVLLQQALRASLPIRALQGDFVALGKTGRALEVSGAVYSGKVKITNYAYNKTIKLKGVVKNHLISQVSSFKLGIDNKTDDLLDCFCYAINLGVNK